VKCRSCGSEIAEKAIVCYRCGTPTAEPAALVVKRGARPGGMPGVTIALLVLTLMLLALTLVVARAWPDYRTVVSITGGVLTTLCGAATVLRRSRP
jgi:hypothetical protein